MDDGEDDDDLQGRCSSSDLHLMPTDNYDMQVCAVTVTDMVGDLVVVSA